MKGELADGEELRAEMEQAMQAGKPEVDQLAEVGNFLPAVCSVGEDLGGTADLASFPVVGVEGEPVAFCPS